MKDIKIDEGTLIELITMNVCRMAAGKDPMDIRLVKEYLDEFGYSPKSFPKSDEDYPGMDALKKELIGEGIIDESWYLSRYDN